MIEYKKLTNAELDTFIGMRIAQLTEEYTVSGKTVPEDVDLRSALKDFYNRHMADGTFVSWLAMDGDKIVAASIEGKDETPTVGGAALEELEKKIVEAGSADFDAVSGATVTSTGVQDAVKAALAK